MVVITRYSGKWAYQRIVTFDLAKHTNHPTADVAHGSFTNFPYECPKKQAEALKASQNLQNCAALGRR